MTLGRNPRFKVNLDSPALLPEHAIFPPLFAKVIISKFQFSEASFQFHSLVRRGLKGLQQIREITHKPFGRLQHLAPLGKTVISLLDPPPKGIQGMYTSGFKIQECFLDCWGTVGQTHKER